MYMSKFFEIKSLLSTIKEKIGHDVVISLCLVDDKLSLVFSFYKATGLAELVQQTMMFEESDFEQSDDSLADFISNAIIGVINKYEDESKDSKDVVDS